MIITKRDEIIYEMAKDGISSTKIAEMFDISKSRVRQIYTSLNDYKTTYPPLKKLLSVKVQKILIAYFNDEHIFEKPEEIVVKLRPSTLRKIHNIGRYSVRDISKALISLGYIKQNDKWLKE